MKKEINKEEVKMESIKIIEKIIEDKENRLEQFRGYVDEINHLVEIGKLHKEGVYSYLRDVVEMNKLIGEINILNDWILSIVHDEKEETKE